MSDQTALPPPLPPPVKRARFKKTRILLFTLAIVWIGFRLLSNLDLSGFESPDLKIQLVDAMFAGDGRDISITNVWDRPVTITGMSINNRDDCHAASLSALRGDTSPLFPRTLQVGDQFEVLSTCKVVRVEVQTDKGSDTFTLN
jgi:hypothetical protein